MSQNKNLTRGKGLLEPFLANLRAHRANKLIPISHRQGRILDIGCGSYPYFLAHTVFAEKFAVDQIPLAKETSETLQVQSFTLDLEVDPKLPFDDEYFEVVTLLAVVEHLDPEMMAFLFTEVHRVLRSGGLLIMTTPASWSDGLLHGMAHIGLVSKEEIHEHTYAYNLPLLGWYFGKAGFAMQNLKFGYFEFMLNMWATAEK